MTLRGRTKSEERSFTSFRMTAQGKGKTKGAAKR